MKRILILLIFLFVNSTLLPNGAPTSEATITEIFFNENGEWTIELYYDYYQVKDLYYVIITANDTSTYEKFPDSSNFVLLTIDDLDTAIDIDPTGDLIELYSVISSAWYPMTRPFSFGNHPEANVNAPVSDQSLVGLRSDSYFDPFLLQYEVIDTSSSIGHLQDPAKGKLEGFIYDSAGNILPYIRIQTTGLKETTLWSDENGYFSDSLYAKNYALYIYDNDEKIHDTIITIDPCSVTTHNIILPIKAAVDFEGWCQLSETSNHSGTRIILMPECPFAPNDTAITDKKGKFNKTMNAGHYYMRYSHEGYKPYYTYLVDDIFEDEYMPTRTLEKGYVNEIQGKYVSGRWDPYFPYWIFGDIEVPAGEKLILDPGVRIEFKGYYSFDVSGSLIAVGNEDDSIYIVDGIAETINWSYLRFNDTTSSKSILDYAVIQNNDEGITLSNSSPQIIHSRIDNIEDIIIKGYSSPLFSESIFSYSYWPTYWCMDSTFPIFQKNIFYCKYPYYWCSVIGCLDNSKPDFYYNDFYDFDFAIGWSNDSSPDIIGNIFHAGYCSFMPPYNNYSITGSIENNIFNVNRLFYYNAYYPGFGEISQININGDSCDIYGNLFMDPLLVDPGNGDFHLLEESPCIDAGHPNAPYDPDSTIADIGALYFNQLFTRIKQKRNINNQYRISHYPNPVSDYVTFIIDQPYPMGLDAEILIYNIQGEQITSMTVRKTNSISNKTAHKILLSRIGNFSSGNYVYALKVDNQYVASGKLVYHE